MIAIQYFLYAFACFTSHLVLIQIIFQLRLRRCNLFTFCEANLCSDRACEVNQRTSGGYGIICTGTVAEISEVSVSIVGTLNFQVLLVLNSFVSKVAW